MATRVDNKPQSCRNQTLLSYSPGQIKIQNKAPPKNNSCADWAWDDEGAPASVSPDGGSDV